MFVRSCYPNSRNLKSPLTFPMRFIGGSFLCQRHNDPAVSLLKTAISGSETLIFQIGRLTVSGGISLGHVILHHCQGGAWAKQAISRLASQKNLEKKVASLGRKVAVFCSSLGPWSLPINLLFSSPLKISLLPTKWDLWRTSLKTLAKGGRLF